MKKILVILDGIVAKKLLQRIIDSNIGENYYDVIYINDVILPAKRPSNFTFYKFDPTSSSKLAMVLDKNYHSEALIALNSKDEMMNVIEIIKEQKRTLPMNILDYWGIELEDSSNVSIYKGIDVLANGMVERLPNIPVVAQNIGLKQGEIMEIRIPFGSSYAYRYIGSIEQQDWKIFGLYRNNKMIKIKPSLILKPNDVILVIGKPEVLIQVHNAIGKTQGQFPMPFGHNIYLYLDLYAQNEDKALKAVREAKHMNKFIKNRKLIVRITKPTTVQMMNAIQEELRPIENVEIKIDYHRKSFVKLFRGDMKKFDIGMVILSYELLKNQAIFEEISTARVPILKLGFEPIENTQDVFVLLNDTRSYEQISPIVFDIASQLKTRTKILDLDPIGDDNQIDLLDHFENLAKIFSQKVEIISKELNPIRELKNQSNILQLMPLKKDMFKRRYLHEFFYTNSDLLSFDMKKYNQLLIPIVEE